MQKINLRELYPDVYKTDVFVDVAEEVVAAIRGQEQDDAAYERRKFRHKAHYSLNREDGIENDALNRPLTPAEVLEQKLLREEVYAALMQLTDIQARRIYARFYLGMTVAEIGSDFDPDRDPSVDPVLWEIRRERLIELMGESFSFEDVRRWKKADWYVNKQHYGAYVENATTQGISSISLGETGILKQGGTTEASASELAAQGNAGHLYFYQDPTSAGKGWLEKYYLMPIPSGEILLNENLEQQELWK